MKTISEDFPLKMEAMRDKVALRICSQCLTSFSQVWLPDVSSSATSWRHVEHVFMQQLKHLIFKPQFPGWLGTHDPPASASQFLGLQTDVHCHTRWTYSVLWQAFLAFQLCARSCMEFKKNCLFQRAHSSEWVKFGFLAVSGDNTLANLILGGISFHMLEWVFWWGGFIDHGWRRQSLVAHDCNVSTGEIKVEGSGIQGYLWLYREFEVSLGHMRSCLKKQPFWLLPLRRLKHRGHPQWDAGTGSGTWFLSLSWFLRRSDRQLSLNCMICNFSLSVHTDMIWRTQCKLSGPTFHTFYSMEVGAV